MVEAPTPPSLILIICGPAGSGKTTLCDRLLETHSGSIRRLITTTSRDPRPGETDGVDYHFLSEPVFKKKIQDGEFIEWALVHGRYYGSQKSHVRTLLAEGKDLLLNIDIQGAQAYRREGKTNPLLAGRIHTVFIKPASLTQIRDRLEERGTDDQEEIARRIETAHSEIEAAGEFDHVILSGSREADFSALLAYYHSLKKESTHGQPSP